MNKKWNVRTLAMVGVMAALTFVASFALSFPIATPVGMTRIHLGNVICLLCGMILGPVAGGLASGIGSMLYDFTNPAFVASAPFTLVFKFLLAYLCGLVYWRGGGKKVSRLPNQFLAAVCGAFSYVILYLGKNLLEDLLFLRVEWQTALIDLSTKAATSVTNAVLAVIISVPLAIAVRKGLEKAGIYTRAASAAK